MHRRLIVTLVAAALASPLRGETSDFTTLSLEELVNVKVVTASKYEQALSHVPASVYVISAEDIKRHGFRTLPDALEMVPGLYSRGDRYYRYLGVRGFSRPGDFNTRVLLLIDGQRVNDNVFEAALLGHEALFDLEHVERIEFVAGPGSSLYGTNAFFGVINVITRDPAAMPRGELTATAGAAGAKGARALLAGRFGDFNVAAAASSLRIDGRDLYFAEFDTPETNFGIAQGRDGEKVSRFFVRATGPDASLTATHSVRDKGVPTAYYGSAFNTDTIARDQQSAVSLNVRRDLPAKLGALDVKLFYNQYRYRDQTLYDFDYGRDIARLTTAGQWLGTEAKVLTDVTDALRLVSGVEYQYDRLKSYGYKRDGAQVCDASLRDTGKRLGVYAQGEYRASAALQLTAGVRHDKRDADAGVTNPRFALVYNDEAVGTVKLLHGRAYRAQSYGESLAYVDAVATHGPSLAPERIRTDELVWEKSFTSHLRLMASAYRYRVTGLVELSSSDGGASTQYINGAGANARGGHIGAQWASTNLNLRASYSRQTVEDSRSGEWLTDSPKALAKLHASVPLLDTGAWLGWESLYISARRTKSDARVGGGTMSNVTISSLSPWRDVELSASVYNVFNKTMRDPAGNELIQESLTRDPRTVWLRVGLKF